MPLINPPVRYPSILGHRNALREEKDQPYEDACFDYAGPCTQRQTVPASWCATTGAVVAQGVDAAARWIDCHLVWQGGDGEEKSGTGNDRLERATRCVAVTL